MRSPLLCANLTRQGSRNAPPPAFLVSSPEFHPPKPPKPARHSSQPPNDVFCLAPHARSPSTMDLSSLTRPAVLCQCSRCSSSLAVLENEWAKLSNSYSVVAGWLSVNLNRILISSERKQIPQTSELSLLRGRILQEIGCKLCQLKVGVLCALDNGCVLGRTVLVYSL